MPSLADGFKIAMDDYMTQVHTTIPAKIVSYDSETNKAKVKATIKKLNQDETLTALPIVASVPVEWPSGSNWGIKGPLVSGDLGRLVFAEVSIDRWLASQPGEDVEQDDPRKFDLSDAIFIPGLKPFKDYDQPLTNDTDFVFYVGTKEIRISPDGFVLGDSDSSVELLDEINTLLTTLQSAFVTTALGPQPLDPVTQTALTGIVTRLATIKGSF